MNVNKIRELGEQHKALKHFHETCNRPGVEITASSPADIEASLGIQSTQSIICEIRHILLKRIQVIEQEIKGEATI